MELVGGIGLFLLGMIVMTSGLREIAGDAIRHLLIRFTRTPLSGAVTGACATAILQSSSATTVAVVGFVAANVMSFPAGLGIIFGANIGTTLTGWMVALVGFKLKLGLLALPLVFAGSLLRLLGSGRLAGAGMAVAGFGLLFVGIATMQEAMLDARDMFDFSRLTADSFSGRLILVGFGIGFTLVTQSSSAGVAATLTALFGGLIDFGQAAALVIGMDVGTTITAALAAAASNTNGKRAGFSHVIYNLMTGIGALFLIDVYVFVVTALAPQFLEQNAELALVTFHTLFNAAGVIVVLPFARPFARMMERLIPGDVPSYTQALDPALKDEPRHALNAVLDSSKAEFSTLLRFLQATLDQKTATPSDDMLDELSTALDETLDYLDGIHLEQHPETEWARLIYTIHVLDHMQRLHERLQERPASLVAVDESPVGNEVAVLRETVDALVLAVEQDRWLRASKQAHRAAQEISKLKDSARTALMNEIGTGRLEMTPGNEKLSLARWLLRVSNHLARITEYFANAQLSAADEGDAPA